ncbi:MAG: 50S ribosomal protein L23 [Saprospiraceae bacterium]
MGIIIKPVITEKAETLTEKSNKYCFVVEKSANKVEIKKEIEKLYSVNVTDVNTIRNSRKSKG